VSESISALGLSDVVLAGHRGNIDILVLAFGGTDPHLRALALGGLAKNNALNVGHIRTGESDPADVVRHRIAQLGAVELRVELLTLLCDHNFAIAETAAWSLGERVDITDEEFNLLITFAGNHEHQMVRESCVAALGAIGDPAALPAILAACSDKPAVRRRAILALAPFEGPEVEAALQRALGDRDWQVRQAAEDLLAIDTSDPDNALDMT